MYSNKDFRSYQELYHAEEKKKNKWPWLPGGKNTPEYNHWYYMTHPEKWGITKAGQQAVDAVKKGVDDFTNWTETDLDNKAVDALSRGYNTAKNAVTNSNAYKTAKNAVTNSNTYQTAKKTVNNVRAATEAMQRRDAFAERERDAQDKQYKARATNYGAGNVANNTYASSAAQQAASSAQRKAQQDTDVYSRRANTMNERKKQESANASRYLNRAGETAKNLGGSVVNDSKNLGTSIKNRVNNAIDNNNTQVDNRLRDAFREARSGNWKGAAGSLRNAGSTAVSETKKTINKKANETRNAINKRIDDSDTVADNMAREAFRNLREGNTNLAKGYARGAVKAATNDAKKALGNAVDNVGNTVSKVKNAAEGYDAYKDREKNNSATNQRRLGEARSKEGGETGARLAEMTSNAKKNSIEAAKTASKSVRDIYDHAMKELGDIRDKYGQNSPQYLEALKDIKQDAIQAVTSTGSSIRTAFQNAPGTVMSVMSSGAEWISNTFDGLISREEQILMSPEAEERQRQQQNTKLSGRYTDFDYENEEADRRRRESQRK